MFCGYANQTFSCSPAIDGVDDRVVDVGIVARTTRQRLALLPPLEQTMLATAEVATRAPVLLEPPAAAPPVTEEIAFGHEQQLTGRSRKYLNHNDGVASLYS